MSNILVALAYIRCRAKRRNTINKLLFAFWFNLSSQIFFNLMPKVFNRIQIGGFRWSSPPVYAHFFKESLGIPRTVFRIVVLHKPVRGWRWKSCFNEGKKGFTKYNVASIFPSNMHTPVAPFLLIPTQTCTFTGCLGCGFGRGFMPSILQQKRQWVSSCTLVSSLLMTSSNVSVCFVLLPTTIQMICHIKTDDTIWFG